MSFTLYKNKDISEMTNYSTENFKPGEIYKDESIYQSSCFNPNTATNVTVCEGATTYVAAAPPNFSLEELESINNNIIIENANGQDNFNQSALAYSLETFSNNEDLYLMLQQYQNAPSVNEQTPIISHCDLNDQQLLLSKINEDITTTSTEPMKTASRKKTIEGRTSTRNVRDERRRSSHNEVERKRRGKINDLINQLNQLVPESFGVEDSSTSGNNGSKGKVLSRIYEYMVEVTEQHKHFEHVYQENVALKREIEVLQYHHQQCAYTNSCDQPTLTNQPTNMYPHHQNSNYSDIINRNPPTL